MVSDFLRNHVTIISLIRYFIACFVQTHTFVKLQFAYFYKRHIVHTHVNAWHYVFNSLPFKRAIFHRKYCNLQQLFWLLSQLLVTRIPVDCEKVKNRSFKLKFFNSVSLSFPTSSNPAMHFRVASQANPPKTRRKTIPISVSVETSRSSRAGFLSEHRKLKYRTKNGKRNMSLSRTTAV